MTSILLKSLVATATLAFTFSAFGGVQPIQETFEPAVPAQLNRYMKVAVIQWAPSVAPLLQPNETARAQQVKQRNRLELTRYIQEAASKGAKLIVSSEIGVVGYPDIPELPSADDNFLTREQVAPYAEQVLGGPSAIYFGRLAQSLGVYIQYGDIEVSGSNYHNVAVAVDPNGQVVGKHRKISLYKQEQDYFTPGTSGTTYETPAGRVGMLICADVYHSPLLSQYARNVDVLALSTSWAQENTGWSYFSRAARSVGAFMLAANQPYFPDSGVANPDGSAQSHIRQTDGIAYGYLPLKTR